MYRKDDKERILADLHESGMSVREFSRQPGNPSRVSLDRWLREEREGLLDVPRRQVRGRCEHAKHRRYPQETRSEALRLLRKGLRPAAVARRLGISSGAVVSSWRAREERGRMPPKGVAGMGKAGGGSSEVERLRAQLEEAVLENRVLRELMRDPKAGDPASLSNLRKAELGERLRRGYGYSQRQVTGFLRMPRSTYAYNVGRLAAREARAAEVAGRVRHAFEASRRVYGYRRIAASVRSGADGLPPMAVSEREVRSAMREGGMEARRTRRAAGYDSYEGERGRRPPNAPLREDGTHAFSAPAPGEMAVTDVTEFKVGGGKVYLSPVLDCFDGLPAAWRSGTVPDARMCRESLEGFLATLPEGRGPVVAHTDGGGQYFSGEWIAACEAGGVVRSMSRRGACGDNARAEGFFGVLKEEFYNGRDWGRCTPERFVEELDAYIEWYREGRLKAFEEDGKVVYDTIMGRRRRLGYAA